LHINPDGTIDVDGDVYFNNQDLDKLPLKFNKVSGYFYCSECSLISLEGCPKEVGDYFDCSYNQLTSLIGGPNEVGVGYYCYNNELTSLEGCPRNLSSDFYCNNNFLKSFDGCPDNIGGTFVCKGNPVDVLWNLFKDYQHMELFNDLDIIRDDNVIILDRLNDFLDMIGRPLEASVKGYTCI
jgi:hypothetical protein